MKLNRNNGLIAVNLSCAYLRRNRKVSGKVGTE